MATQWGQRKALGRRYSTDPALLMELERLEKEYSLAPGREARALQADQFNRSLAQQNKQFEQTQDASKTAGMLGTGVNALSTAGILRAATMEKGEPFFGNTATNYVKGLFGDTPSVASPGGGVTQPVASYSKSVIPQASETGFWTGPQPGTVNPAMTDISTSGISPGAQSFTAGELAGDPMLTGMNAVQPSFMNSYAVPGAQALALYAGSRAAGGMLEKQPWAPKEAASLLKHPVTGMVGEPAKLLGKATGIKEIGNVGTEVERIEDQVVDFITNPIESISSIFGGW